MIALSGDAGLPTRFEIAAEMAVSLALAARQDGFDLGDERCVHACLDHAGFDPVDVADVQMVDAAVDRARGLASLAVLA